MHQSVIACDFCGKNRHQVEHLVTARKGLAAICGPCATTVLEVIQAKKDPPKVAAPVTPDLPMVGPDGF